VSQAELAVHCRKVEDVRRWLNEAFEGGPSGKLTKYRVRGFFVCSDDRVDVDASTENPCFDWAGWYSEDDNNPCLGAGDGVRNPGVAECYG